MSDLVQQPDGSWTRQAFLPITAEVLAEEQSVAESNEAEAMSTLQAAQADYEAAHAVAELARARTTQVNETPAQTVPETAAAPVAPVAPTEPVAADPAAAVAPAFVEPAASEVPRV